MTERVHGYIIDDKLGFLMGENAFVSIAIRDSGIKFDTTGVITPLNQFKALYAYNPALGIAEDVDQTIDVSDGSGSVAMGGAIVKRLPNIPRELRIINGVEYTTDMDYLKAWCAQENLRRIVDTIQQRAVLIAVSGAGVLGADVTIGMKADGTPVRAGNAALGLGQWSNEFAAAANTHHSVTFLVERGTAFDKARPNAYGQPGGILIGQELIDDLTGLPLVYETTLNGKAAVASEPMSPTRTDAAAKARFAVRIDRSVPQII